jgi:hypothetical protein
VTHSSPKLCYLRELLQSEPRISVNHPPTTTPSTTMAAEKKERTGLIVGLNKGHV